MVKLKLYICKHCGVMIVKSTNTEENLMMMFKIPSQQNRETKTCQETLNILQCIYYDFIYNIYTVFL